MDPVKQLDELIFKLETTLSDSSITVEDIYDIWNENVKKIGHLNGISQEGSPVNKKWNDYAKAKAVTLKDKGNAELTSGHNKEAISW